MEWSKNRKLVVLALALASSFVVGTASGVILGLGLVRTYQVHAGGIVAPTMSNGEVTPGGATAVCSPNDKVVGGGYALDFAIGVQFNRTDVEPLRIRNSQPYVFGAQSYPYQPGQQGWWVAWWWEGNSAPKFTITIWAVCQS